MANKSFNAIINSKIDIFLAAFKQTARDIYYDEEDKHLFHPLEYGMYREAACKEFLQYIIPSSLSIDDGFLMNTAGYVSTQCDIVIFDAKNTPLFETGKKQRFFPVETVVGVGEVKSNLSKEELKKAVNKLARIKASRRVDTKPAIVYREAKDEFSNYSSPWDNLFTFLICDKFNFNPGELTSIWNNIYDSDIPVYDRHNMILSLSDGIFLYKHIVDGDEIVWMHPFSQDKVMKNRFVYANNRNHIRAFCTYMFMGISAVTIFSPPFSKYLGVNFSGKYTDET